MADTRIGELKTRTQDALTSFLHSFSFVPEEKLDWSPAPTAKSAIQIAAHCAAYSGMFAWVIREKRWPCTLEEWKSRVVANTESISSREEAIAMLKLGIEESLVALDTVSDAEFSKIINAPHAQTPFTFFLNLPAIHLETHESQIDYLQTCWGDLEVHFV
jgi:hypothetical protein